jgi:hypothetical protein
LVQFDERAQTLFILTETGFLLMHGLDVAGDLVAQFFKMRGFLDRWCSSVHGGEWIPL